MRIQFTVYRTNHGANGNAVGGAKLKVALIVRGYGHDGAGAIIHQHEVPDPHRDLFAAVRIHGISAGKVAVLLDVAGTFLGPRVDHLLGACASGLVEQLRGHWMLRRQNHARGAVDSVDPSGEDADLFLRTIQPEIDLRSLRAADPVALHGQHTIGPMAFELLVNVAQQFVGVGGSLPEPLLQRALLHRRIFVTPAAAFHHLFVGQHRAAFRAPVHQRFLAIRQAALQHLEKKPLIPAIIFGFAGGDLAIPVIAEGHAAMLPLHLGDVRLRPLVRIAIVVDGGVFRGKAERVPAHGVQNVVASHPFVTRQRVADRVVADVADVQAAAWIGQHFKHIIFGARGIRIGLVKIGVVLPALMPLQLDLVMVVRDFGHSRLRVSRFFRSSPSCSTGVSRIKALLRSPGWARMRRNPSRPI